MKPLFIWRFCLRLSIIVTCVLCQGASGGTQSGGGGAGATGPGQAGSVNIGGVGNQTFFHFVSSRRPLCYFTFTQAVVVRFSSSEPLTPVVHRVLFSVILY